MSEDQIKQNIAGNITRLRKEKGMTQAELSNALNYSDKSVSKWERGEGLPDVLVLYKIAELFDVSINDLLGETETKKETKTSHSTNKIIISLLSVGLVFLVLSVVYFFLQILLPSFDKAWLLFILALPVSCIPLLVFSCIWWELPHRFLCVTALTWSLVLFLCLAFNVDGINNIIISASVFQILSILWFIMRYLSKKRKKQ